MNHERSLAWLESKAQQVNLKAEVALYANSLHLLHRRSIESDGPCLVTGVTGFLGAFLTRELLEQTDASVYCLVRAPTAQDAAKRLRSVWMAWGIWHERYRDQIMPIAGDISKQSLGLGDQVFSRLAESIEAIYHCAAAVNLAFPYQLLRPDNVFGTHEVIRLATIGGGIPFHYISTIGIVGSSVGSEVIMEDAVVPEYIAADGYGQSKWVAEKIVLHARDQGLPVTVFRPGTIGWHSQTGAYNDKDFLCNLVAACGRIGIPNLSLQLNIAPVDFMCKAILRITRMPRLWNKAFHLINPETVSWPRVVDLIGTLRKGIDQLSYDDWYMRLMADRNHPASKRLAFLLPRTDGRSILDYYSPAQTKELSIANTAIALGCSEISCPKLDLDLLKVYLDHIT